MSLPTSPDCAHAEVVCDFAIGALTATEADDFAAHLSTCANCKERLSALRPVVASFVDWPIDLLGPPSSVWSAIAKRIGDGKGDAQSRPKRSSHRGEGAWKELACGIAFKLLATDLANDRVTMLVRLAPGCEYPSHRHAGLEELHLLAGELTIDERRLLPGDYHRAEPGTSDMRVYSKTGCTCLLTTSSLDELRD